MLKLCHNQFLINNRVVLSYNFAPAPEVSARKLIAFALQEAEAVTLKNVHVSIA